MGKTGKRMYCSNCKKNRTWMTAYKKRQMEPSEKPYDFRFFVCQTCEYAYDPKTSLEIPDWRAKYYDAESFKAQEDGNNCDDCGGFLRDCIGHTDGEPCSQVGVETRLCSKCGDGTRCSSCSKIYDYYGGDDPFCNVCHQMVPYNPVSNVGESHERWCKWDAGTGQTAGSCEICGSEPWMWSNDLGYVFFEKDSPYYDSYYETMCLHCIEEDYPEIYQYILANNSQRSVRNSEEFEAVVIQPRKPKGIIDKILMQQEMMMRAQLQELTLKLDTDVRLGIISEDQADDIMTSALMKMGLMPADFDAEEWPGVDWNDPPNQANRNVPSDWADNVDWSETCQAEKAYDFLRELAKGSTTTELESRFLLSPRHFSQLMARSGMNVKYLTKMEGFGEGPYPVAQDILTPEEIIAQTELQLHTIFEAFEAVLDGVPDDHDHEEEDDDHDHDDFETILSLYTPYEPPAYQVYVRTPEEMKLMGEYVDIVLAQELADDWNAPGYDAPVATIIKRPHRNGAYRGLSRVVFDDESYLTFMLLGDLIHRDSTFVDMTSLFIKVQWWADRDVYWDSERNN